MEGQNIEFAVTSWYYEDIYYEDREVTELVIYMFGRNNENRSVTAMIKNFHPYFYIRIPDSWRSKHCEVALTYFNSLNIEWKNDLINTEVDMHYDLHENFCNNKQFKFMKFTFRNYISWFNYSKIFYKKLNIPTLGKFTFETYEKKIDPIISAIVNRGLNSAGWNVISNYVHEDLSEVTTDIYVSADYNDVSRLKEDRGLPKLVTLSFDIECTSGDGSFPKPDRDEDKIISICGTYNYYGSDKIIKRVCTALKSSKKLPDTEMYCFNEEDELLLKWRDIIQETDPDFITGFNSFAFDNKYIDNRTRHRLVNCLESFPYISRLRNYKCEFKKSNISSAALGDNEMWLWNIPGREQFDTMKLVQQSDPLNEYSLSKCAQEILKKKVKTQLCENDEFYEIECDTNDIIKDNYVKFKVNDYMVEKKIQVQKVTEKHIYVKASDITLTPNCEMCLSKDDMGPQEIFDNFKKGPNERKLIHQYCLQDCALVNLLCHKRDFITSRMALASVANVPFNYIIMRGQGIKTLALFAEKCKSMNYVIRDIKPSKDVADAGGKIGYEGATVLEPKTAFYQRPITTLDFNSLYPSVEMAYNMSHETLVTKEEYMNLPDYHYRTLSYPKTVNKIVTDEIVHTTFATHKSNVDKNGNQLPGKFGIVGSILNNLITKRKYYKKLMEQIKELKDYYNALQNAFKITANSIYGQLGSGVSPVSCVAIAAATTAGGRMLLQRGKDHLENECKVILKNLYNAWKVNDIDRVNEILEHELEDNKNTEFIKELKETLFELFDKHDIFPTVAYGDTDSNFIDFRITNVKTGNMPIDRWARVMCMKLGEIESKLLKIRMPYPNNMAYEKVIHPMALMAKKNYMGRKYENDPDKFSMLIMGFKLKRRDGSIVFHKVLYSSIMKAFDDNNPDRALKQLQQSLHDVINGKYEISDFITTSLLRAKYKGLKLTTDATGNKGQEGEWFWWDVKCSTKHVALCQRMRERDIGNAPTMNSRIPYVFVVKPKTKTTLQGDLIEHPDYVLKHNLKIDYLFYITNQIQNPAIQFFSLISEDIEKIFNDIISAERIKNEEYFENECVKNTIKEFKRLGINLNDDPIKKLNFDDLY